MLYGIDIGGTKIELAVFNEHLERLSSKRILTPHDSYLNFLNAIVKLVKEEDERYGKKGQVGIGLPGIINRKTNIVNIANISVANNKKILEDLSNLLERNIYGDNDANCFALSEAMTEEYRHCTSVLGLILGTGFGGGIIFNHKTYSGLNGIAGEVGHSQLSYEALKLLEKYKLPIYQCGCGKKACLDTYLSGRGFELLYQDIYKEQLKAIEIIQKFYTNDDHAITFVKFFIKLLAISLSNIITILDPEVIVLGGGLSNFDYLYDSLSKVLPNYLIKNTKIPQINKAKFGDAGGARGAAALCKSWN